MGFSLSSLDPVNIIKGNSPLSPQNLGSSLSGAWDAASGAYKGLTSTMAGAAKQGASTLGRTLRNSTNFGQRSLENLASGNPLTKQGLSTMWNNQSQNSRDLWNNMRTDLGSAASGLEQGGRGAYNAVTQATPGWLGDRMQGLSDKGHNFRQKMRDDWFNNAWELTKTNLRSDPILSRFAIKPTNFVNEKILGLNDEQRMKLGTQASALGGSIGGYFGQGWIGPAIGFIHGVQEDAPATTAAGNALTGLAAGYSGGVGKGAGQAASSYLMSKVVPTAVGAGYGYSQTGDLSGATQGAQTGFTGGYGGLGTMAAQDVAQHNPNASPWIQGGLAAAQAYGGNYSPAAQMALNEYAKNNPNIQQYSPYINAALSAINTSRGSNSGNSLSYLPAALQAFQGYVNQDPTARNRYGDAMPFLAALGQGLGGNYAGAASSVAQGIMQQQPGNKPTSPQAQQIPANIRGMFPEGTTDAQIIAALQAYQSRNQ